MYIENKNHLKIQNITLINGLIPKKDKMHAAIIMDGNRRYAKHLMEEKTKGHEYGVKKFREVLEWCKEFEINELTMYTFSIQNFNRPKHEFDYLMNIIRKEAEKIDNNKHKVNQLGIKVRFLGRLDLFPEDIQNACKRVTELTKNNKTYTLNLCFGYGGREEIMDAVYKIAKDVKEGKIEPEAVDEELIDNYVYMKDKPDFIIRTGGDRRTSNFLNWQSAYSEWFFIDKMWPEFTKDDFKQVVNEFNERERRYGK